MTIYSDSPISEPSPPRSAGRAGKQPKAQMVEASQVDLIMPCGQTPWEEVLLPELRWGKSLPLFSGQRVPFCWELEGFGGGET